MSGVRRLDRLAPLFREIIAKGQAEFYRQQQCLFHAHGIHLVEQVGNSVCPGEGTTPQALCQRVALQYAQCILAEVAVDVDVQVQFATGFRGVTIQQVAHALRACQQIEFGPEQHRHAEVAVHVDGARQAVVAAAQTPAFIQFEPRQFGQPAIAPKHLLAERAATRRLRFLQALAGQLVDVRLVVASGVSVSAAGTERESPGAGGQELDCSAACQRQPELHCRGPFLALLHASLPQ